MNGTVFVAPIDVPLVLGVPKPAFGGGLVKAGLQLRGARAILRCVSGVPQQFLRVGPQAQGVIQLSIDERILVRRPDDVDPIASALLRMGVGHHFDQPVSIRVAAQQVTQHAFAGGLLPAEPGLVTGEVK